MTLQTILPYMTFFLAACITVGGAFAYRQSYSRSASEIQERVIQAQKAETESLRSRIEDLEREQTRLGSLLEMIQAGMKQKGILITINGEMLMIDDQRAHTNSTIVQKIPQRQHPRGKTP